MYSNHHLKPSTRFNSVRLLISLISLFTGSVAVPPSLAAQSQSGNTIESCKLVNLEGNRMTLRVGYRIHPSNQPIYAGAWLYSEEGRSIDAGYLPVAIEAIPQGAIEVILTLPERSFTSDYVEVFLMEGGKSPFVKGRFEMAYRWEDGVLSPRNSSTEASGKPSGVPPLQSNKEFCEAYARRAIEQYHLAVKNNLPGITPPVWGSDSALHYNWCLTVPREQVAAGSKMRQDVLDQHKVSDSKNTAAIVADSSQIEAVTPNISGALTTQKQSLCEKYAATAISQEQENQSKGCGFSGPAWNANLDYHFQWCMQGENLSRAEAGTGSRSRDLDRCSSIQVGGALRAPLPNLDPQIPDIVERWAPVIYQDIDGSFWQADMITSVNYDGNWNGSDNTANLHGPFASVPALVYYSLVRTASHDLIGYYFYHAEDTTPWYNGGHEHDFEGILVAVNHQTEQPEALLSNVHGHTITYVRAGLKDPTIRRQSDSYGDPVTDLQFVPGSKPGVSQDLGVGIEANTHATWGRWNTRCVLGGSGVGGGGCDSSHGGDGIRYYYGARSEVPSHSGQYPDWPKVSYQLEDIQTLWQRAFSRDNCGQIEPTATFACQQIGNWSTPWDVMNSSGKDTGDLPWVWGLDRVIAHTCQGPSWLLDPAAIFLYWFDWKSFKPQYTTNPYSSLLKCN